MLSACLFACLVANLSLCLKLLAWVVISQHDCFSLRRLLIDYGVLKLCFFVGGIILSLNWPGMMFHCDPGWCRQGGYYPIISNLSSQFGKTVCRTRFSPNLSPRQCQFGKTSSCTRHFHEIKPSPRQIWKKLVLHEAFSCNSALASANLEKPRSARGCFPEWALKGPMATIDRKTVFL